jgi:hypothetical protein
MKVFYFIGKQLARLRFGKEYMMILSQTTQTISLLILAFGEMGIHSNLLTFFVLFNFVILFFWFLGYTVDKKGIREQEMKQTILTQIEGTQEQWKKGILPVLIPELRKLMDEGIQEQWKKGILPVLIPELRKLMEKEI